MDAPDPALRIGIARLEPEDIIGAAHRRTFAHAARMAATLGDSVTEVEWPHDPGVAEVFRILQGIESRHSHRIVLGSWPGQRELYGSDLRARLDSADSITDDDVAAGRRDFTRYRQRWQEALTRADVVLLPAAGAGPSTIADPDRTDVDGVGVPLRDVVIPWQSSSNLLGVPSCVVPAGIDGNGLPIGIQVIGRANEDRRVLAVAHTLRQALRDQLPAWPPIEVRPDQA